MKKIIFALLLGVAAFSTTNSQAQVNVNINLSSQPEWGPSGYNHVDYYYLPDLDVYYYVPSEQYVYENNGKWKWSKSLPSKYKNYDLYNSYKVVMNQKEPYLSHDTHVKQYSKYKNNNGKQVNLRDKKSISNGNNGNGNNKNSVNGNTKGAVKPGNQNTNANKGNANSGNGKGQSGNNKGSNGQKR